MTTAVEPARLPRGVRIGYGSGSIAKALLKAFLERIQRPVRHPA